MNSSPALFQASVFAQEPVWINTDLSSKRQDSLCMSWCFIRTQNKARWTSRSAKHLFHTVCVHSYSKRRAVSRRKGNPIHGQKLQLSLYANRKTETFGNMKTLNMQLRQYMVYLCFSSHLHVINKVYKQCSNWQYLFVYINYSTLLCDKYIYIDK